MGSGIRAGKMYSWKKMKLAGRRTAVQPRPLPCPIEVCL